jgi:hypothetical protein
MNFKDWYGPTEFIEQALGGILAMNLRVLVEGRKDPSRLQGAKVVDREFEDDQPDLFSFLKSDEERSREREERRKLHDIQSGKRPEWKLCPVTPLSAYAREIEALKRYSSGSADAFAQVLMFSPLSANVSFAKHWDNFPVVMTVLKTMFPDIIKPLTPEDSQYASKPHKLLEKYLLAFSRPKYSLGATVAGWKYKTIAYVWNNRHQLKAELDQIAHAKGDEQEKEKALIMVLKKIPGVAPVKAGFIAQLLYGKAGCIDTHNIDIYIKAFPDMKGLLDPSKWSKNGNDKIDRHAVDAYSGALQGLRNRGIGTQELWDVWVDFVGRMYEAIMDGGQGLYKKIGPALNPLDPKYKDLRVTVPKERILASGKKRKGNFVGIDAISGTDAGGGASLTHNLPAHDPAEMRRGLHKSARGDADAPDWASAVVRHPKMMGDRPASDFYFGPAMDDEGNTDEDKLRDLIAGYGREGVEKMKKKMQRKAAKDSQRLLF